MDLVLSLSGKYAYSSIGFLRRTARFERECYYWPLRKIYREVRGDWLEEQKRNYDGDHPLDLRTFWYFDHEPFQGHIKYIVTRQIGKYWPGRSYDPDHSDPPGLFVKVYQRLYECDYWVHGITPRLGKCVLVHPLDAEEVE